MSAPKQRSGNTKPVRSASLTNTGDSATRQRPGQTGPDHTIAAARNRPSTRFKHGQNPGVSVGNAGNGRSNAAMAGFPHKAVPSNRGIKNLTARPGC